MCDAAKAMLTERFIALTTYIRREERSQICNQSSYFKKLVIEEQLNRKKKPERRKLKIRAEISEIETRNQKGIPQTTHT